MKHAYRFEIFIAGLFYILLLVFLTSCEQEEAVVEMNAAPGGGTVTTYKAYDLSAATGDDIHGRVVFYKDNSSHTLVQVSLYNTDEESDYTTTLFAGDINVETPEMLENFYLVDGSTGEFAPSKFFVISDKAFFDSITELDAHLKIMAGDMPVSSGNIGKNAAPVAESE